MPNIYLLLGPEIGLKKEFVDRISKQIEKEKGEKPEIHKFYPFKAECRELVSVLQNTSLFSRHRLVILNQAHEIKKKADVQMLAEYCTSPADDATLIMMSDTYQVDRRLSDKVPKNNRQVFWELFENKKREWIHSYFKKAGFGIEKDAVELLLELVENDTEDLRRECERLALYLVGETLVTEEKVEEVIYHSKAENIFTLFDRMACGNLNASLEILQSIKLSGDADPGKILGGLIWQFRRVLSVKNLLDQHIGREDAFRQLKIKGKKNQRTLISGCETYSAKQLQSILSLIANCEADLRSGSADLQSTYLQKFIFDAVKKKGMGDLATAQVQYR
jgi:DNA polymerase III subunit delta